MRLPRLTVNTWSSESTHAHGVTNVETLTDAIRRQGPGCGGSLVYWLWRLPPPAMRTKPSWEAHDPLSRPIEHRVGGFGFGEQSLGDLHIDAQAVAILHE